MAESKQGPPIQFRDALIEARLDERVDGMRNRNAIAQRDLERYYYMLQVSLPTFGEDEASLIVDALNGILTEPHTARLLWAEVEDAISGDNLAEKWGVDGLALTQRLRALTPFEALAVADAAECAWKRLGRGEDISSTLRAVGLVKDNA